MTCAHLFGRARAADTPDQRRALTLAAAAGAGIPVAYLACLGIGRAGGETVQVGVAENVAAVAVAAASWFGIIRYGLFDSRAVLSRAVLSRTLLYGSLTVVVVAVYLAASALLRRLFAGDMPTVVAAGPGRAGRAAPARPAAAPGRLVFGLRDDPVAAFGLLGVRLDAGRRARGGAARGSPHGWGEALRLRCVTIEVGREEMARWGQGVDGARLELDLPSAGESIGRLTVQARDQGEPFGAADRSLLESLASQVSVAARAVALTQALQASRERLVATREEERRRLRRDLHDGLGPTLAGVALASTPRTGRCRTGGRPEPRTCWLPCGRRRSGRCWTRATRTAPWCGQACRWNRSRRDRARRRRSRGRGRRPSAVPAGHRRADQRLAGDRACWGGSQRGGAVALCAQLDPDVVVMDVHMPGLGGVEAARQILRARPQTAIVMLTMMDEDDSVFAAMRAGARGYVLKGSQPAEILRAVVAVVAVASGQAIFGRDVAERMAGYFAEAGQAGAARPFRPAHRAGTGDPGAAGGRCGQRPIAARLGLTEKTIRNNVFSIFVKHGVSDRAAAVARARDAGIRPHPLSSLFEPSGRGNLPSA